MYSVYTTVMVVDITTRYHFNVIIIIAVIFGIAFNCAFVDTVLISSLRNNSGMNQFLFTVLRLNLVKYYVDYGQCKIDC